METLVHGAFECMVEIRCDSVQVLRTLLASRRQKPKDIERLVLLGKIHSKPHAQGAHLAQPQKKSSSLEQGIGLKPHFLRRNKFGQTPINLYSTVRGFLQPKRIDFSFGQRVQAGQQLRSQLRTLQHRQ